MQITAVVLDEVGGPVAVREVELDPPRTGEVLVRMRASGVCHSDQHSIVGDSPVQVPCIHGHEGAGDVVAVGPGVHSVAEGDRVALNWLPSCGDCFYCRRDQHELCGTVTAEIWSGFMPDGTSRLWHEGRPIHNYCGISTWADHMVVDERCCQVVDPRVPYEVAAVIGCAVSTGVGAAVRRGGVGPGDRLAVVGVGGVGLSVIMGARMAGAERIIAIDREPTKEALATELGATDFVLAGENDVDGVLELTEGRGADVVVEAIGNVKLQQRWLDAVRPGGTMVLVGLPPDGTETSFVAADLSRSEKTITGSFYAGADAGQAIDDLCAAYLDGRLPVDRLISMRVPIQAIQDALDAMVAGTVGRAVIIHD